MASKPALRNLLMNETKVNFIISASAALVVAAAYKFGVEYRRKKKIEDFFANYDLDASYKRMKAAGVFQLYNPDKDD
ncbi:hypothetical protein BsWGS_19688 [Bradybaena similaris]